TGCHDGMAVGSSPSLSKSRRAPVVSPSPQNLSRGKAALSITITSRPARASVMAAAAPAGPPPTTATSAFTSGEGEDFVEALLHALHQHIGIRHGRRIGVEADVE